MCHRKFYESPDLGYSLSNNDDKSYESWMSHVLLLLVYLKLSEILN